MTFDARRQVTEPSSSVPTDASDVATAATTQSSSESQEQQQQQQPEMSSEELIAAFPVTKLTSLNIKISSPRWVVPVMPEQELECLLNAAIQLSVAGVDADCEPCLKFYRDELSTSFIKILTDEAVNSWKYNIHHCILMSCGKLLHLCALHMKDDNPYLLELLGIVMDPENKFHTHNASRHPELYVPQSQQPSTSAVVASGAAAAAAAATTTSTENWGTLTESQIFARPPPEPRSPKGWLVDLINRFGQMGGFENLLERFNTGIAAMGVLKTEVETLSVGVSTISLNDEMSRKVSTTSISSNNPAASSNEKSLTLSLIYALIKPFGQCADLLTLPTIQKYFMPIWEFILNLLDNLSDNELKREAKLEGKNDTINGIVKSARALIDRVPNQEQLHKKFEMCRLRIILRVLQISSFNGKMNALNEINKMLSMVSWCPQTPDDDVDILTADKMAKWIKEEDVLGIVLKDSLHQPQYVEKLEKILRFLIKEKALTLDDLDAVWRAQAGKHEAIVKNVHDLLAKLAWDFNAQQLDHLFECFQTSMKTANKKQRERLLELNRRLAEDDKNGVMAYKVLQLFWTLAHSPDIPPEVLDQALASHVKILDYSCSQERDAQKTVWLDKCVEELRAGDNWVLPALKLIRDICCLYEATPNHAPRVHSHPVLNRQQVIDRLQTEHTLVILVTQSLTTYMDKIRAIVRETPNVRPMELMLDKRYPHPQQIQERLEFLKFLLKDGQLWLCADQAKQIWQCLAVNAAFASDREECFRWFGKLMGDEPDLDPGINKDFFENNLLQLDPVLLTESGIKCFERFFKAVNSKEEKLKAKNRGYVLDDEDLIGKDYLWRVITTGGEDIANKAIELLKEVSTALGPRLQAKIEEFHENFISECCDRLKALMGNIIVLTKIVDENSTKSEQTNETKEIQMHRMNEAEKMCRIVRVLQEYIKECDRTFYGDRYFLPLSRASRGKHIVLYVRFQTPGKALDDIEITTHSNEMVISFKRNLLKRIKATPFNNIKVDLYNSNGELIEVADERNPLIQYNIRDKTMINAKLTPTSTGMTSSPETSSDSSTGSPLRPCPDMQRQETEATLPGVIISHKQVYIELFLKIYQMGSELEHNSLRDTSRALLHLLPLDRHTIRQIHDMCRERNSSTENVNEQSPPTPENLFLSADVSKVLYNLEVLHALLIPALDPLSEITQQLQLAWLHSGVAHFVLDLLTKNNFLSNADAYTRRAAFQCVLKLVKLFLYIVGCVLSRVGDEPVASNSASDGCRLHVDMLKHALTTIPGSSEYTLRTIASKMAANLAEQMLSAGEEGDRCRALFQSALQWSLPDTATIKAIVQLAWATANGNLQLTGKQEMRPTHASDQFDLQVCREALEVLSISLVLNSSANEALIKDPMWSTFITSLLVMNPSRNVRQAVAEQLLVSCTYCAADKQPFVFLAKLLVNSLHTLVPQHSSTCAEFFQLLCRTINYGCVYNWSLSLNENLLSQEISWLHTIRGNVKTTGDAQVHEDLLAGHLCLAKELLVFLNPELKAQLNSLILEFIEDFLFPASRQYLQMRRTQSIVDCKGPPPVCRTPHTIAAACDLLVALCQHCVPNMKLLVATLIEMFSADTEPLKEWEYLPPVGPRPNRGFVGLKNAGATCYMNSVLQQLFMVQSIRVGILGASGAATDLNEDFTGETEPIKSDIDRFYNTTEENSTRKNYHVGILKFVQAIFAHLGHSALQYYIPRGLWTHFKLQGEPVNLREQQDAVEFFMSLFESLDEGLKALGHPQLMGATLGGSFSDQKICQGCPHRYSKDEPFSVFSVDIRNHSSLTDSLEQYVKGELLEGADAYHCDKCDKKVVTIKRLCVRKLPPVLAIQLKRFEYDYERVCAIKFNDYFEFPRRLDMEPYTVSGLAKIEGEVIDIEDNMNEEPPTTKYQLTGIVVHSGQASGGHYFSFILHKNPNGTEQWYKFDDGEVSECKMHEDEELKAQCFGGDYMGEVYDNNLKRMQYRRQKRWWNAYMLFYTRCDQQPIQFKNSIEQMCLAESKDCVLPMPEPIERSVRTQNIKFLHARSMFSVEFFTFIRKIVNCTAPPPRSDKLPQHVEELSLLGIQLASQFLFHSGLRTKKTLRGPAIDWYDDFQMNSDSWYDVLCQHIRASPNVRRWFAANVLLNPACRLGEYILIAPSPEVRTVFVKLVVFFCHFAINDDPLSNFDGSNLCEQVLIAVLSLLKSEVAEHGKHLPHYFSLFSMYAGLGIQEKHQLLKLNVPAIFMQVALEEGPGPSIKYQYPDISKLHQVVSNLVRSSDISTRCVSSNQSPIRPNIYAQPNVPSDSFLPLSQEAQELLFNRTGYVKKLIEDTNGGDDVVKLLQYCSWENPHFSRNLLTELLWHCGFAYWHDMRHHTELLLSILLIEDSWQHHRIHNAIMGISEDREGLLETIIRNKNNYQKRSYQCIKCMVQLFTRSQVALTMLNTNQVLARQWAQSVEWLQDELDRQRTIGGQYNFSSWSPPAQSNESTNSFILERSLSAKNVLRRALELCPDEEADESNDIEVDPIDDPQNQIDPDDDQQVPIATISSMVDKTGTQFSAAPPSSPMHQANSPSSLTETETGDTAPKIVASISKTSLNQLSSADNTSTSDTGTTQIHNTSTETNSVSPVSMEQA